MTPLTQLSTYPVSPPGPFSPAAEPDRKERPYDPTAAAPPGDRDDRLVAGGALRTAMTVPRVDWPVDQSFLSEEDAGQLRRLCLEPFREAVRAQRIEADLTPLLDGVYLPLAAWLRRRAASRSGALVVGICGAQGSGKSTVSELLRSVLERGFDEAVAVFSIDDIYRTREERQRLAAEVHPLFATRGVPGTHDVDLGLRLIEALGSQSPEDDLGIPSFDKSRDDRRPQSEWPRFAGSASVILFRGLVRRRVASAGRRAGRAGQRAGARGGRRGGLAHLGQRRAARALPAAVRAHRRAALAAGRGDVQGLRVAPAAGVQVRREGQGERRRSGRPAHHVRCRDRPLHHALRAADAAHPRRDSDPRRGRAADRRHPQSRRRSGSTGRSTENDDKEDR